MTNATARKRNGVKMTLRVYRVDRSGTVTENRGTTDLKRSCERKPLPLHTPLPPCACPIHRAERPAAGR